MTPRHGEIWLVDMGMAAKTRPTVVLIADNLDAPRSLIIHIPISRHNRGTELEVPLGHLPFLDLNPSPMSRPSARCRLSGLKATRRFTGPELKAVKTALAKACAFVDPQAPGHAPGLPAGIKLRPLMIARAVTA